MPKYLKDMLFICDKAETCKVVASYNKGVCEHKLPHKVMSDCQHIAYGCNGSCVLFVHKS